MRKDARVQYRQWLERGMEGFIPFYDKDGRNGTLVILENQPPIEEQRRLCTVLEGIAGLYQKSVNLIKKQARSITGQRTMNPLPLFPAGILIPFRMRKPIGRDDGALGYFFHHSIEEIEEKEGNVQVILKDGQRFQIMDSIATARHRISCAYQIRDSLTSYEIGVGNIYGKCMELGEFYNQPATKADIVMLTMDLANLVGKIGR